MAVSFPVNSNVKERKKMSFKRVFSAAVAAIAIGSAGAAFIPGTANAATPSCGNNCINIFSKQFGTFKNPNFVMDVYKQGQKVGQPIILFRTSNSDPAEDFTVSEDGQVSDFFQAGLVSSALNLHYGCNWSSSEAKCTNSFPDDYAFEEEYAPFGADTGLCVGVASTATANEQLTLQACGVSSKTVWVVDTLDSCISNPLLHSDLPVINGSDTNFSHPFVMTYPGSGFPTDNPRPKLFLTNLSGFSQNGNMCTGSGSIAGVNSNELWAARTGVLP